MLELVTSPAFWLIIGLLAITVAAVVECVSSLKKKDVSTTIAQPELTPTKLDELEDRLAWLLGHGAPVESSELGRCMSLIAQRQAMDAIVDEINSLPTVSDHLAQRRQGLVEEVAKHEAAIVSMLEANEKLRKFVTAVLSRSETDDEDDPIIVED